MKSCTLFLLVLSVATADLIATEFFTIKESFVTGTSCQGDPNPCLVNGAGTFFESGTVFLVEHLVGYIAWDVSNYGHTIVQAIMNLTNDASCASFDGGHPCINLHGVNRTDSHWNETGPYGITGCPNAACGKQPAIIEPLGTFVNGQSFGVMDVTTGVQNCLIDQAGIFSVRITFLNGTDGRDGGSRWIAKEQSLFRCGRLILYRNA